MQNQFVEIDEPLPEGKLRFEEAATVIQRSVIAIAFGLKNRWIANIVGTGLVSMIRTELYLENSCHLLACCGRGTNHT